MAVFDLLSAIVGFVVGGIAIGVVFEALARAKPAAGVGAKLTTAWRLSELSGATLVVRDLSGVDVPAGTRILASGLVDPVLFQSCEVRQVPPVRAEFALDAANRRAFLFLAGVQPGAMALVTVEPETVQRLRADAQALWEAATPYVERRPIAELGGRSGITIETEGLAQEVLPFKDRHLIRLEDQGHIIGVIVDRNPMELRGSRLLVRGKLTRDRTGYASIEATDIRRIH